MKVFILLDSNALVHRAYHALPPLTTKRGKLVNALYGFALIFFKIIRELKPDYLAAAFDVSRITFRSKEYKDYKAKRAKTPQELYGQIPLIKQMLACFEVPIYEKEKYEADDIIGTIVSLNEKKHPRLKNIILTGDLDTLQLVSRQTEVYAFKKGITKTIVYNQAEVKKKYGLRPEQLIDFKGLRGDPSDNIPGVSGVGEKTAISLIQEFGSLEFLYQKLGSSDLSEKLKARLLEYKEDAYLSKHLVTIKKDVDVRFNFNKCIWGGYDHQKTVRFLKKFGFKSLIDKLP